MRRRRNWLAVTLAVTAVLGAPSAARVSGRGLAEFFGPFAVDASSFQPSFRPRSTKRDPLTCGS